MIYHFLTPFFQNRSIILLILKRYLVCALRGRRWIVPLGTHDSIPEKWLVRSYFDVNI